MHSCELITNLRAKKVLCHRIEVVKNFRCYNHRLCFLQCDWLSSNSSWKSNQLNEAWGIGRRSPDPFSLVRGRVWARDYTSGFMQNSIALFPGLPRFFFFGLRSVWYTEVEELERRGRPGNTYHVNDDWWTWGGRRGGGVHIQITC